MSRRKRNWYFVVAGFVFVAVPALVYALTTAEWNATNPVSGSYDYDIDRVARAFYVAAIASDGAGLKTSNAGTDAATAADMWHDSSAAKTLTNSYVAGDTQDLSTSYGVVTLFCTYTPGAAESANSVQVKLQYRNDSDTNWFDDTNNDAATSINEYSFTMVAGAGLADRITIQVPIGPSDDLRLTAKETGVAANYGTLLVVGKMGW